MKHAQNLTKSMPVKGQILPEGHPDILDSIKGFVAAPLDTVLQHLVKEA